MSLQYSLVGTAKGKQLIVSQVEHGITRTLTEAHPNFAEVLQGVLNGDVDDTDILGLIDVEEKVVNDLRRLSERVIYRNGVITFDGDVIDNSLTNHILRIIRDGEGDLQPFVAFLENVATNPSNDSKAALFSWLKDRDFTITDDGHFLAYKGVNADGTSINSGKAIVDGVEVNGNIPNEVGSVIEMPRSEVDDNTSRGCSFGLHAGTDRYARWFASNGKTLLVSINPRDVVSVPHDSNYEKLRVCRYTVLELSEEELTVPVYVARHRAETAFPVVEDEPEEETTEDEFDFLECDNCGVEGHVEEDCEEPDEEDWGLNPPQVVEDVDEDLWYRHPDGYYRPTNAFPDSAGLPLEQIVAFYGPVRNVS